MGAPCPAGQTIRGIGIGVPSIVKQPVGEVVLTLGLGWRDFPLRQLLSEKFDVPVFVENGRNLAGLSEWGFGAGSGADSVVSLSIGPGAGAGRRDRQQTLWRALACRGACLSLAAITWSCSGPKWV